ncbi:MAG: sugar phosphate isomerase/epimerase [Ruminococcus sp.]|nr:sugar phosphate isomerase/epimerase [Candidatus Copronaster equi]
MIGFTSVTLRKYTIDEVVEAAVKAEADFIEWGSDVHIKSQEDAHKAKRLCDENGIKITAYATYYKIGCNDLSEWKKLCEIGEILGAEYIRTWLGQKGSEETDEKEYLALIEETKKMSDIAKQFGLIICNECHPHTYNDTTASSVKYLKDVSRDNVRTYYQSWYRDEAGDREKLFELISYVQNVHLSFSELIKFQRFHKKDRAFIDKILSWLKELDFSGNLIIEFTKDDSVENLVKDLKKLKSMWNK